MHLGDPGALDDLERPLKRVLVLGREADDDVRREVEVVQGLELGEELGSRVAALHRLQHGVVSGLERNVEMTGHRPGLAERRHELIGHVVDLDRREPQSLHAGDRPGLADKACERVPLLTIAEAAEVDACENDLRMPL